MEPTTTTQSHILALPTEILCLIFWFACCPTRSPLEHVATKLSAYTEVQISHICRHWRSTSLNYSRLWATISYDRNHLKIRNKRVLAHLRTYLRRAAGHLLDVRFASLEFYSRVIVQNMLELLLENSSTWHRIFLFAPINVYRTGLSLRLQEVAPYLASYEVKFFNHNGNRSRSSIPNVSLRDPSTLLGTPKLTHLSFQTVVFMSSIPCSPNITTIYIENRELMYTWTSLLTLLRLPYLRTLSIVENIFLLPMGERDTIERITAPELVQFRCSDETIVNHILYLLHAPKLDVLVLKGGHTSYFSSSESLPHALSQGDELEIFPAVFPSLRTLVLLGCASNPSDSEARGSRFLAHATKSITNLCVSDLFVHKVLRCILKTEMEGVRIWPNLKLLAMDVRPDNGHHLPLQFWGLLAHRSGTPFPEFKLALPDSAAAAWGDKDAASWSTFVKTGYYHQTSPGRIISDISRSFNPDGIFDESVDHFKAVSVAEGRR